MALSELLFVADNLAYFSYEQLDEPLFVMNQIDVIVSTSGSLVLDMFSEVTDYDSFARIVGTFQLLLCLLKVTVVKI